MVCDLGGSVEGEEHSDPVTVVAVEDYELALKKKNSGIDGIEKEEGSFVRESSSSDERPLTEDGSSTGEGLLKESAFLAMRETMAARAQELSM